MPTSAPSSSTTLNFTPGSGIPTDPPIDAGTSGGDTRMATPPAVSTMP